MFHGIKFLLCGLITIIAFAALFYFAPKSRKVIIIFGALFLVSFIIIEGFIISQSGSDKNVSEKYVIVLGAGLYGETPSMILTARLEVTYDYMIQNPESIAILCGGQGADEWISESEAMRRYLLSRGIGDDRLILEDTSTNTIENIKNASNLLEGAETAAIVSNDFHLYRAKKLAARYGITASGISAPTPNIPFLKLNYYFREYFSVIFMWRR